MTTGMEIERVNLGRLERLDLRAVWGDEAPDLIPWLLQNLDLVGQTLGIDITPAREDRLGSHGPNVLGLDPRGRPVVVQSWVATTESRQLGELMMNASMLESAVVVWVAPRFKDDHRRALDWLNDRTDENVDFFAVELGLVRIGRSLPAPVLDVVVQPSNWRKYGRARPVPPRPAASSPLSSQPPPTPFPLPGDLPMPPPAAAAPPPPASTMPQAPPGGPPSTLFTPDGDGGQAAELRHRFFELMFDSVARRLPGFRIPKFGYESWVGFAAGPFGFYDVAFTTSGAVRAGIYLDMQERIATKHLFDDLYAERFGIETAIGRVLSWERLDDRRASRIVDYRDLRDPSDPDARRGAAEWAAETVVKLMDALDGRLRNTAQALLSRAHQNGL
jgi:Domain of unknown function (DUF4268)